MALGALLDLGVPAAWLSGELTKLRLGGFGIEARKAVKRAIQGTDVNVALHGGAQTGAQTGTQAGAQTGTQAGGHAGGDGHGPARCFRDIAALIDASGLSARVKESAKGVFREIAEAEGRVHGQPADDVHFHEVGAVDSIVDVVGVCACIERLGVGAVYASELHEGRGYVMTRHGLLPVPVPAVVEMLKGSGIPVVPEDVQFELATPTGVGILKHFAKSFGPMPPMRVIGAGYGFGKRETGRLNALRAVLGEALAPVVANAVPMAVVPMAAIPMTAAAMSAARSPAVPMAATTMAAVPSAIANAVPSAVVPSAIAPSAAAPSAVVSIEANIDDMTPEALGYAMERLLARGALDVFFTPIYMKKSRPATMLTVLAGVEDAEGLVDAVFEETTTIGVRMATLARDTMARRVELAHVPGVGDVRIKASERKGVRRATPEYEDVRAAAIKAGRPFIDVFDAAKTSEITRKTGK